MKVADADFAKIRARQNRIFLHDVVVPHIENMPTAEDYVNERPIAKRKTAVFNLNEYMKGIPSGTITDAYSCGRQGCFAGWYVYLSDKYNRLSDLEQVALQDYNGGTLGIHFGIHEKDADSVFGSLGNGAEKREGIYCSVDNRTALAARKKKLISLMKRKKDFS